MNTLRVLAMLAISVGCAPAVGFAEHRSSAQRRELGGVAAAALIEAAPQTGLAHTNPASCPYRFDSNMPSDTFCVYYGVAFGRAGEVCASGVVVMWSRLTSHVQVRRGLAENASASNGEVDLGFATYPELVVRALVDPRREDRAELVSYTRDTAQAPQALAGRLRLGPVRPGSVDVLNLDMREPGPIQIGSCAFASYSGTFIGMIGPPSQTTVAYPGASARLW